MRLPTLFIRSGLRNFERRLVRFLRASAQILASSIDAIVQTIAASCGLSRLLTQLYGRHVPNLNRLVVLSFTIITVICIGYLHYLSVVTDNEIPILGSHHHHASLIFPPIGNSFYPQVPPHNTPPRFRPRTPLLIPFTRNHALMQQAILSYIAAGWPRADIIIVDNSGTMDANNKRLLSPSNPFYLDYQLYRESYGITILQTPTLLNFAQLQNFMLRTALARDWPYYFWGHMDVAMLSAEELTPYKSLYQRVLDALESSGIDQWTIRSESESPRGPGDDDDYDDKQATARRSYFAGFFDRTGKVFTSLQTKNVQAEKPSWAVKLFAYDYLTLVNVDAWRDIGQWDVFIPYYTTDCDAYQRLAFAGYTTEDVEVGHVFDMGESLPNPEDRFFFSNTNQPDRIGPLEEAKQGPEPSIHAVGSLRYKQLFADLTALNDRKHNHPAGRNLWQQGGDAAQQFAGDMRKPTKASKHKPKQPTKDDASQQQQQKHHQLDNAVPINEFVKLTNIKDSSDDEGDGIGKPKRGKMEPWTYDPRGFQAAWWAAADAGRVMYVKKWGTMDCDLKGAGKTLDDIFLQAYAEKGTDVYYERKDKMDAAIQQLNSETLR